MSVAVANFPPVYDLTFEPTEAHIRFAETRNVGVTLLHSHDGHSELFYSHKFTRSRPPTEEEKATSTPCSFYADAKGGWTPYEWTSEVIERPAPVLDAQALQELRVLCEISGVDLGITVRPCHFAVTELEVDGSPGHHVYVPLVERPARRALATQRTATATRQSPRNITAS